MGGQEICPEQCSDAAVVLSDYISVNTAETDMELSMAYFNLYKPMCRNKWC